MLDLRFADDIVTFARTSAEAAFLLDDLVYELSNVGLVLNASKTVMLTSEAQPPDSFSTPAGISLKVFGALAAHKWLGCMLSTRGSHKHGADADYHIQCANKAFYASRWLLCDRAVSLAQRLKYFQAVVTAVACFAAGHRTAYKADVHKIDVHFRKLLRQVVGPPGGIDWSQPWHGTLHIWHERVNRITTNMGLHSWSTHCLRQYWRLACYIAGLPEERWVLRVLKFRPCGRRPQGAPRNTWESKIHSFCRMKGWGDWLTVAAHRENWLSYTNEFVEFCSR